MRVAGFVLTGGQSRRMGQDKALLPMGPQTLCEHVGDTLSVVAERVFLVGHPERYGHLKYTCVADKRPDLGPLSGLETALNLKMAEFCVVSSCDAVNVQPNWLNALLVAAEHGARCAVVEEETGQVQPLCGVYRSDCREVVTKAISEGRLRMMDLVEELGAHKVRIAGKVLNLNTPEEYADSRR